MQEKFMRQAIRLAKQGTGQVSPNPLVGCVITKDNQVISTGFHEKYGEAHAEANALAKAGLQAKGAEAYVSLEPCVEFLGKKTPSCAKTLVEAGVKKVFIGVKDPSVKVRGKGIEFLREEGIEVTEGILEEQCKELNKFFFKHSKNLGISEGFQRNNSSIDEEVITARAVFAQL